MRLDAPLPARRCTVGVIVERGKGCRSCRTDLGQGDTGGESRSNEVDWMEVLESFLQRYKYPSFVLELVA